MFETSPFSAYTAAGYELCRISHEAFECDGPGRIMVLEYDEGVATASIMRTPLLNWSWKPVTFALKNQTIANEDLIGWIDSFVDSQHPNKLLLAGAGGDDSLFRNAVARPRAAAYSDDAFLLEFGDLVI